MADCVASLKSGAAAGSAANDTSSPTTIKPPEGSADSAQCPPCCLINCCASRFDIPASRPTIATRNPASLGVSVSPSVIDMMPHPALVDELRLQFRRDRNECQQVRLMRP